MVKSKNLTGALEVNNLLDNAEHLYKGEVIGPMHMLSRGKSIYAALHNGYVVRIDGPHITPIVKLGVSCSK